MKFPEKKAGIKLILTPKPVDRKGYLFQGSLPGIQSNKINKCLATPATACFDRFNSTRSLGAGFSDEFRPTLHIIRLLFAGFLTGIFVVNG
jgi:hypothetical protein